MQLFFYLLRSLSLESQMYSGLGGIPGNLAVSEEDRGNLRCVSCSWYLTSPSRFDADKRDLFWENFLSSDVFRLKIIDLSSMASQFFYLFLLFLVFAFVSTKWYTTMIDYVDLEEIVDRTQTSVDCLMSPPSFPARRLTQYLFSFSRLVTLIWTIFPPFLITRSSHVNTTLSKNNHIW